MLGRVVDGDSGQPLGGALVTLTGGGAEAQRVLTNGDGQFVLRDMPGGAFTLSADAGGYTRGVFGRGRPDGPGRQLELNAHERRTDVVVRLWRNAAITGIVFDEAGEPAVGARVRAWQLLAAGDGGVRRRLAGAAVADDRGIYWMGTLVPGNYIVGIPSTATTVPLSAVAGYYMDLAAGSGMDRINERRESRAPSASSRGVRIGDHQLQVSATAGFAGPPPDELGRLLVYRTVYAPSATAVERASVVRVASGEERGGVDIRMQLVPTVSVSGTVTGPDGPAAGLGVHLVPPEAGELTTLTNTLDVAATVTDATGRFTFLGVPAGEHTLLVLRVPGSLITTGSTTVMQSSGSITVFSSAPTASSAAPPAKPTLWATVPVSVEATNVEDLTVTLQQGARLSGKVQFQGAAPPPPPDRLARVSVRLTLANGTTVAPSAARFDEEGQFQTVGYPPGRYLVEVRGSVASWQLRSITTQGRDLTEEPFELGAEDVTDMVVTFSDRVASLSGTVQGRDPVDGARALVVAFPADYRAWIESGMTARRAKTVPTGRGGRYELPGLVPGEYLAVALPDDVAMDVQNPDFIETLARLATKVVIMEGQPTTQILSVVTIR